MMQVSAFDGGDAVRGSLSENCTIEQYSNR
jgi:hypothetical protein